MIADLDADKRVALVDENQGRNDQDMFDTSILDDEEVVAEKEVSTANPVPIVGEVVTTAVVEVNTAAITSQISIDEITLAKALFDIKTSKPKAKGIVIQEPKRLARQKEEEASVALVVKWDNTQAMMDAYYKLAARLQEKEREELTIKEKELMDKRKKHFARLGAKKIRSKPPTKTQKRNQMCTYLTNMINYKHSQLKNKSFKEIQMLFNNNMKWIESFVPMKIELVKGSENVAEGCSKRARSNLEEKDAKRQRIEEENESAELKRCLEIILDDNDDVKIKATLLSSKSPTIDDYKIYKEGRKGFFKIIRADGNSQNYLTFGKMFKNLNREDMEVLWSIVKARFQKTKPVDDMDNLLFQTLKIKFEHHVKDNI
nr:hypothetical protein [Tanacetum cinerariifolium]